MRFKDIDHYRTFESPADKSKYIDLLNMELSEINKLRLDIAANIRTENWLRDARQHFAALAGEERYGYRKGLSQVCYNS